MKARDIFIKNYPWESHKYTRNIQEGPIKGTKEREKENKKSFTIPSNQKINQGSRLQRKNNHPLSSEIFDVKCDLVPFFPNGPENAKWGSPPCFFHFFPCFTIYEINIKFNEPNKVPCVL